MQRRGAENYDTLPLTTRECRLEAETVVSCSQHVVALAEQLLLQATFLKNTKWYVNSHRQC